MARGSVVRRLRADGEVSWRLVYDLGPDPATGARRQRTETVRGTKREAQALLARRLVEVEQGQLAHDRNATVAAWLRTWLVAYAPTKRPSTAQARSYDVEHYLIPTLGAVKLAKLTTAHVRDMLEGYDRLARNTRARIRATLCLALNAAVADGLIPRNPAQRVRLPAPEERRIAFWTPAQVRRFLDATRGSDVGAAWAVLVYAHLRHAELVALRWGDLDWQRSILRVERTVTTTRANGEAIGPPKTKAGRRAILLPAEAMDALRDHKERQDERRRGHGSAWIEGDWVFDTGTGRRWSREGLRARFNHDVKAGGLPRITPKGLRHSGATMLLAAAPAT